MAEEGNNGGNNSCEKKVCEKCKGTGRILSKDGTMHVCWDCLAAGEFDQHSENVKDSGIRF
jgi:DnaJ-class molecular chaperone